MVTAALPNGVISSYAYDALGRLQTLSHAQDGDLLSAFAYSYDPAGNRLETTETMLWVQAGGSVPPEQFSAVEQGYLAIALAWPDSTIDEEGYTLERSTDGGQHWQLVAELSANTLRYVDYGLARHTRYDYRLTAHNSQGGSQVQTVQAQTGWDVITDGTGQPTTEPRSVAIIYTYDPLNRLSTADYDDGTEFGYTYDAAGNTLQAVKTIDSQTTTTTYTYDADNQLATSQEGSGTVWQYAFDGNGSLTEMRPGAQPGNGARRYTYNTAGQLVQVESHDGAAYQAQAEMVYNGLGQRKSLTAHQGGQSLSTAYLLDGNALLAATSSGQTTYYLPGIGEAKAGWSYYLADGTNSVRQLTDPQGDVTLTRSFNPWGDLLEMSGAGDFTWGYLGGLLDAATGLIYVGNGQYYDPATGRFLTRGVYPGSTNPYVPWQANPLGMIIGPLGLLAILRGKRKAGKFDRFLLLVLLLVVVVASMAACNPVKPTPIPPTPPTPLPSPDPTPSPNPTPTPGPTPTPFPTPVPPQACDPNENWTEIARVLYDEGASSFENRDQQEEVFRYTVWSLYSIKTINLPNYSYTDIVKGGPETGNQFSAAKDTFGNTVKGFPEERFVDILKSILCGQVQPPPEFQNNVVHFISSQHFARRVGESRQRQEFQHDDINGCRYSGDPDAEGTYCVLPDLRARSDVRSLSIVYKEDLTQLGVLGATASALPDGSPNTKHGHVRYEQAYYYEEAYWIGIYFVHEGNWGTIFELGQTGLKPGPTFDPKDPLNESLVNELKGL